MSNDKSHTHSFLVHAGDHAETPWTSYRDIEGILSLVAQYLGKSKSTLKVYDPYYCQGTCVTHLSSLGFTDVYNKNEDFYEAQRTGKVPLYDVLVTNPPFSGDHMERILEFVWASNKPFLLLLPQYVSKKAYFLNSLKGAQSGARRVVSYLGPLHEPYAFTAPSRLDVKQMREARGAEEIEFTHSGKGYKVGAGSFQCVWFFSLGMELHDKVIASWHSVMRDSVSYAIIAENVKDLPQLQAAPKVTPAERRWRKKSGVAREDSFRSGSSPKRPGAEGGRVSGKGIKRVRSG